MSPIRPYHPREVEQAAQAHWRESDAYRAGENDPRFPKGKFYCVSMLPYPSGKLHMGHVRNYTINDVMYRHLRMNGWNVLMPMGWDAFGLPAENAAMKNRVAPARWTYENIEYMKQQCQAMGWAIDWSREIATCKPDYYRWNQWLFLRMLEKGIAYKKTGVVNWDPVDQTVLANEQVIDGRGWRSGAVIEKREIPMYYLRITDYAEELLATLDRMHGWPERVRIMQANWIGKSVGVRFAFTHDIRDNGQLIGDGRMYVFTTRADTIMGVTFCAVAAEHPLATHAARTDPTLARFIDECKHGTAMEAELATMEKKGMPTGLFVVHPLTGEKVEAWVGNYVLMAYGEGAVMGVPGHDERDFEFAKKYGLPIKQVIDWPNQIPPASPLTRGEQTALPPLSKGGDERSEAGGFAEPKSALQVSFDDAWQSWYDAKDGVCIHSGKYDGLAYEAAVDAIAADLKAMGLGDKQVTYRLRDWGVSRQRYWGTPIPIIHCPSCGDVPVPEKDLPVVLPEDCVPEGSGNPLAKREDFVRCDCPRCGGPARRETDTMDTFVDSSWYYMRYCDPHESTRMVAEGTQYWMPMDQYIGGIEHAILHLLYARFWTKVMRDLGLVKFDEPFTRLLTQGMVLNHIFFRKGDKGGIEYFPPDEVTVEHDAEGHISGARAKRDGEPVEYGGVGTMSKSKLNGVDPQEIIDRHGADTARLYVMFAGPPEDTALWSDSSLEGASRFLKRLWHFAQGHVGRLALRDLADPFPRPLEAIANARREIHLTLKKINYDYERTQYNTVVSGAMIILNALENAPHDDSEAARVFAGEGISILLRVLYPIAPHITHALWQELGYAARHGDILNAPWPVVNETALVQEQIELVLQVNGKLRGHIRVPADAAKEAIEAAAVASEEFQRYANGAAPKKVIVVPGRLVNVVV